MKKKKYLSFISYILCFLVLAFLEFLYHRKTVFMMDDLWYSTNLVTGEPLRGIKDIIEGQVWHYLNWGGRSVTHTVLQAVLMGGEMFADIMNLLMTVVLAAVVTSFSQNRKMKVFLFTLNFGLLLCLNPSLLYSMFWQAGAVNYVYSTVWILCFIKMYIRQVNNPEAPKIKLIEFFIVPLGLISGWSNENMGPASFLCTLIVMIYLYKKFNRKPKLWMILGSVSSLFGSILVILAPGNFVRSEFTSEGGLIGTIASRSFSMLTAVAGFLLPSLLVLLVLFVTDKFVIGNKLIASDVFLFLYGFAALGAMILSPHFPARAAFGIMVVFIILIERVIEKIVSVHPNYRRTADLFLVSVYIYSITEMILCVG